ncbi:MULTISPECIES: hypothetical protein [Pseudonocardia]|uniref:Secreted protein n=2 Tax=Pseudonocardia TaxID=1847 RepID=A0A1Y2MXZ4_PSEAH|nr:MULTISPECIES: hypothetical protein [Pseudonocardia]OSY40084.1 hypothetical protein BG845_02907 [Pseudonocardia autotrophica]TDN72970.1 hypothetical protein C8E95_2041 [Pseudonocardia autotrophica]BBG03690.1 hypothetical protein Pdca_48990 [Pseudonocardia autotrophica]GEC29211.1 hypothetical protein PSA01_62400 [Pseudonocardia saturnea]
MNTALRLSVYGAAVLLLAAGAYVAGTSAGTSTGHLRPPPAHAAPREDTPEVRPAGLASTADGYTLEAATPTLPSGAATEIAFRITGADGAPVTTFDVAHEKRMHLILLRRDTAGFQHLHPEMSGDGTWRAPVTLDGGGTYRVFADFTPTGGEPATLGVDLSAPGPFEPVSPQPSRVARVDGGYEVQLDGDLRPGETGPLTLTVTRDGRPVTDLQPYLGASGHLVALRTGDLAYLHVHPEDAPGAGPGITFHTEVPSAGTYRLFLDFRHDDVVRTAEFTVPTTGNAAPADGPAPAGPAARPGPAGDEHSHDEGGHR